MERAYPTQGWMKTDAIAFKKFCEIDVEPLHLVQSSEIAPSLTRLRVGVEWERAERELLRVNKMVMVFAQL